jgi:hypothetical protein
MIPELVRPDERVFKSHLQSGAFITGVLDKRWRHVSTDWPHVVIAVSAVEKEGWPSEYFFKFECSNYPQSAATARPWDVERDVPLEFSKWPGGKSRVPSVFRHDWEGGVCLYLPCDRISIQKHDATWLAQYGSRAWKSTSDITLYLEELSELLNSSDYTGPRGS